MIIPLHDTYSIHVAATSQLSFSSKTPGLADAYLGIWLGQNGLSDDLRSALLR